MAVGLDLYPDNRQHAFYGAFGVLCVIVLSLFRPSVFGTLMPLTWLPLAGVFLWPRKAEPILSLCLIFILGFVHDMAAGYAIGMSSALYIFVYGLSRSRFDFEVINFLTAWFRFLRTMGITVFAVLVLLFLLRRHFPISDVLFEALGAIVFFPVFYMMRRIIRRTVVSAVGE